MNEFEDMVRSYIKKHGGPPNFEKWVKENDTSLSYIEWLKKEKVIE